MRFLNNRDKLILAGLFLSKFDTDGLQALGFSTFSEAFNAIALSLNSKPASLKNYRDEFDPYFPNPRQGWHKRGMRDYCKNIMDEFNGLDIDSFATLLKTEISTIGEIEIIEEKTDPSEDNTFAKRLITGQAAEKYFETMYNKLPEFQDFNLVNTTGFGCGFDYKMLKDSIPFLAVEVKGMASSSGAIMLTSKEHRTAQILENRYYLFVVRNFIEKPFHTVFQNPLNSTLAFDRRESVTIQVSWSANIQS
jgi:Domain of unknown function (DUF3883)